MPVGTRASVKSLTTDQLKRLGSSTQHPALSTQDSGPQIILNNTYHLMLRPGVDLIEKLGGVHKFMGWDRAVLTDSGGFQLFSLASIRKIREEGVEFRSHIDGSPYFLTPERSVQIQTRMGVDIAMAFDECPAYGISHAEVEKSMLLTHRWAKRSLDARTTSALFGIVQGGVHLDLRKRSVEEIAGMDFDGFAIGGVSVGEPKEEMFAVVDHTAPLLPVDKPRYLMGVGTPEDLVNGVAARDRHVRLRDAHAERPERHAFHEFRQDSHQEREVCGGRASARSELLLRDLYDRLPGLPAVPLRQRRDRRECLQHDPQSFVLP